MSIILDLFTDALGSMIQERHTGIGGRMSKELPRAISGKRLVRKYATKSIPAFRSPDVPYFPRSAFGRVLNRHITCTSSPMTSHVSMLVVFSCHEHRTIAANKQWLQCEKGIALERPECSIPSNADPTLAGYVLACTGGFWPLSGCGCSAAFDRT